MDILEAELKFDERATSLDDQRISHQCFLAKLTLALTIPSFCSKFIYVNDKSKNYGEFESDRYPQWCDEYLEFPLLSSKECYAARCSLLHCGDDNLKSQKVLRNEFRANEYVLSIPYSNEELGLMKIGNYDSDERTFCSNGLVVSLVQAYEKFKKEYPDFVYPLQHND